MPSSPSIASGTIVQVNSQAQELFGYDHDELIGQKVEMLVPEELSPRSTIIIASNFAEAPKTRRMGADLDLYGRRRNGSEFPVEISLSPVVDGEGNVRAERDPRHQRSQENRRRAAPSE